MTEPQSSQSPYQGISGPGGNYAPTQDQMPYAAQNPYGQQQPQYGQGAPQNPYAQAPQNPYGNGNGTSNAGFGYGPPPKRRRGQTLVYVRLGIFVVVLIAGGISWMVTNSHKSHRDATGTISKGGNLDAVSLRAGDCYERPADASVAFDSVKAIPCTQPHNAQAFYSFTYPGATSVAPTDDDLTANAQPLCENAAKTKVDQSKLPQSAEASMLFADGSTWSQGYHDITCVYENDADYTGSILAG
ncbi:hypothetical protein Caci_2457 [Catenulispora acidiphila DSM 44928]|uniref:Septum formation-related domain-containing protein n=2 Tax=Catenulispora TaxID=414878 RepID=C7PVY3_CATAD|nr:hypothetical protein Caci_2457 [Catenulispora acidiphila DSM 44928]